MSDDSWLGPPIDVRPLFAAQHASFTGLLRDLDTGQWAVPTACPGWSVKDVAAHVLGDHMGRLSAHRDGFQAAGPREGEAFPAFLDRINAEWVTAARRIGPPILIELLEEYGEQVAEYWPDVALDAHTWPVTWAGADPGPAWLDAARDFTEYWTHGQQIHEALGRPGLADPAGAGVVIDTFLRALPHTLRDVRAPEGTTVQVIVTGPGAGEWFCTRTPGRWALGPAAAPPEARIELDTDTAWRLCTRGVAPEEAATRARVEGDHRLATAALGIVSIIWDAGGN
ncbi:maleylpyruvate isomerase family mycothiol-dependent enzyme [Actinomadura viridis]|uniref:maleylpyruvate isomerase family mycothiol-dependent enzyme n=1 Tax=Actinomadura viridis TaxID=58110 RepID=UPI00368FFD14